ncbi:hypothetical protein LOK49_LG03G02221 [Camellia lanceoleosa]|uniref:Uncharacterized protein n=1 Tax=Camellia lanceoleosa TaxID=1840588 RepID=A0ACC0IDM6_9ERIC|nr:hypothetical protein LOK49_LG03G02221 [Camellia lanceoleosa]
MVEGCDGDSEGRRMAEGGDDNGKEWRMAEGHDATAMRDCGHDELYSLSEMMMNAEDDGQVFNSCGAVALAYIVLYISYVFIYIYRLRNNSLYLFQFVIENHVLPCLYQLLTQNHKKSIKKEACWTISNITAGNRSQIQAVIEANTILPLVYLLQHAEFDIKEEAAWAISNATSGGSHDQIRMVLFVLPKVNLNLLQPLGVTVYAPQGQSQPPFDMGSNYVQGHGHGLYISQSRPVSQNQLSFAIGRTSVHHVMYPIYDVLVLRNDLKMGKGKIAAQCRWLPVL